MASEKFPKIIVLYALFLPFVPYRAPYGVPVGPGSGDLAGQVPGEGSAKHWLSTSASARLGWLSAWIWLDFDLYFDLILIFF